jgi:acyl-coenzyme A synthetase/AMP-(fatty) acid ligase
MLGGDVLLHADLATIRRALPAGCLVQYGLSLSESARVAGWLVPEQDRHDTVRVASGYLNPGVEVAVLDEAGGPAGMGEAGELLVRTPFAAAGDWVGGRVVAARFPTDPDNPGKRIFRTGDIGRIAPDGVLVVLGRRDRMVKIGGQRVEPATVEMAMRALPGIADAAVVACHAGGEVRLAGFVVPAGGADAEVLLREVRAALRAALPAAMVPAVLRRIDAVPLTPAGKRDDAALAALAGA